MDPLERELGIQLYNPEDNGNENTAMQENAKELEMLENEYFPLPESESSPPKDQSDSDSSEDDDDVLHPNNMDPCFPLDHNGPQLPRDLRDSRTWKEGKKAIYVGTNYPYLHPAHQETILNMSIIHKNLIYQIGFEGL